MCVVHRIFHSFSSHLSISQWSYKAIHNKTTTVRQANSEKIANPEIEFYALYVHTPNGDIIVCSEDCVVGRLEEEFNGKALLLWIEDLSGLWRFLLVVEGIVAL